MKQVTRKPITRNPITRNPITRDPGIAVAGILALATAMPAYAHMGSGAHASGFYAGFTHPWLGLDHLLAMVAVGLLAVRARSRRALPLIPGGFVAGMLLGAAAVWVAPPIAAIMPAVEGAIAASVVLLGLAVAFSPRVALAPAVGLVAVAGSLHGSAHIVEMSGAIVPYILGMVSATALLHAAGVGAGLGLARVRGVAMERIAGAALACGFAAVMLLV